MKIKISLIAAFILLAPLLASAQDFLDIGDGYACSRLGDGRLHVVRPTSEGFILLKKGGLVKAYDKETKKINFKLDVLSNLEKEVNKGTFNSKDDKRLSTLIMQLNDGTAPEIATKELRLANIANAQNQLKQRKTNIKIFRKAADKCDKQKYPGLDALGAIITPVFVRGVIESSAGYLIQIPKPSAKTATLPACLKFYDGFSGEPKTTLYTSSQTFSTNICAFSGGLLGDEVIDCTGPVSKGLLAYYLMKVTFFDRSPDPSNPTVVNTMANLMSIQGQYQFQVIPLKLAPHGDCKLLK